MTPSDATGAKLPSTPTPSPIASFSQSITLANSGAALSAGTAASVVADQPLPFASATVAGALLAAGAIAGVARLRANGAAKDAPRKERLARERVGARGALRAERVVMKGNPMKRNEEWGIM